MKIKQVLDKQNGDEIIMGKKVIKMFQCRMSNEVVVTGLEYIQKYFDIFDERIYGTHYSMLSLKNFCLKVFTKIKN